MKRALRDEMDALARSWPRKRVAADPLGMILRYDRQTDLEVAGLIASALARAAIRLAQRPREDFFGGFKYRFTGAEALGGLVVAAGKALGKYGSLERLFLEGYESGGRIKDALESFVARLRGMTPRWGRGREAAHLLPSPGSGSACKRLNLFLRWMVRRSEPDLGLWCAVDPAELVVPVDVHVLRIARCVGFTRCKTATWKAAEEITRALAQFDPRDPLRYDFALAHLGMMHPCREDRCGRCRLAPFKAT